MKWLGGMLATAGVMAVLVATSNPGARSAPGARAEAGAPTTPHKGRRPPTGSALRIEGDVVGVPAGTGTLTVRVNGNVLQSAPAGTAGFEIDIPDSIGNGMVALEYQQAGVHFTTLLGSYRRLAQLAGTDARLSIDECECARLSAFSTGLQFVVELGLGRTPAGDVQIANALREVRDELRVTSTELARLAVEPALLPPGFENGLALLRDRAAFRSYMIANGGSSTGGLADTGRLLANLPARRITEAGFPVRMAFVGMLVDVNNPLRADASVLERDEPGYVIHTGWGESPKRYSPQFAETVLRLAPEVPVSYELGPGELCPTTSKPTPSRVTLLRKELRRQWSGVRLEVWRSDDVEEISYPECPALASRTRSLATFSPVLDLAEFRPLTNARKFFGKVALPYFCNDATGSSAYLHDCAYRVHAFASNGTGQVEGLGHHVDDDLQPVDPVGTAPFTWTMGSDGALHVETAIARTRFWVVDDGHGAVLGIVYVADGAAIGGRRTYSGYNAAVRVTHPDTYTADNATGVWGRGGAYLGSRMRLYGDTLYLWIFDPAGSWGLWNSGEVFETGTWTVAWGRLYQTIYSDDQNCSAPSEKCPPTSVLVFKPLAQVGSRTYGMEEMYYIDSWGGTPQLRSLGSKPQFHELRQLPTSPGFR